MRKRTKWIVGVIVLLLVVSPCMLCSWIFIGQDIYVLLSLRLYPGLANIGDNYQYYGADRGEKIKYYWTKDTLDEVESYYSKFTHPFIHDPVFENGRLTVFNIKGSELVFSSLDSTESKLKYAEDVICPYRNSCGCINIRLRDLSKSVTNDLTLWAAPPTWKSVIPRDETVPLTLPNTGTLVTYSYFVNDF